MALSSPCSLFRAGNFCPSCLAVYRSNDTDLPMVCCDTCDRWIHCGEDFDKCTLEDDKRFTIEYQTMARIFEHCLTHIFICACNMKNATTSTQPPTRSCPARAKSKWSLLNDKGSTTWDLHQLFLTSSYCLLTHAISRYSCLLCRGEQEERYDAFHRRNKEKRA